MSSINFTLFYVSQEGSASEQIFHRTAVVDCSWVSSFIHDLLIVCFVREINSAAVVTISRWSDNGIWYDASAKHWNGREVQNQTKMPWLLIPLCGHAKHSTTVTHLTLLVFYLACAASGLNTSWHFFFSTFFQANSRVRSQGPLIV